LKAIQFFDLIDSLNFKLTIFFKLIILIINLKVLIINSKN